MPFSSALESCTWRSSLISPYSLNRSDVDHLYERAIPFRYVSLVVDAEGRKRGFAPHARTKRPEPLYIDTIVSCAHG